MEVFMEEIAKARMFSVRPEDYRGNLFMLIGAAAEALKQNGQPELAVEMSEKALKAPTFELGLAAIQEYVSFT
jgi:hypothetical protein